MGGREADTSTPPTYLSVTPKPDHIKQRIHGIITAGAKSLHGIAHRAGLSFEDTAQIIAAMTTEGWFKVVDTGPDVGLVVVPARAGDRLVDAELYTGIIAAIQSGASTIDQIAAWLDMPVSDPLISAVGVSLRIASTHQKENNQS